MTTVMPPDRASCAAHGPVWRRLHVVAAAALGLRLAVAWWSQRIYFPDELFQYLEQAHRLVYGYGFVPWEYRFGTRNWLLPGLLAAVLDALRLIGLERPAAYMPVLKSILAILSVSVVYASYTIGRRLFCERTGRITAVLAALWYELVEASTQATPEVLAAYAIVAAFAVSTGPVAARRVAAFGLLLGTGVALRLQYAPCVAVSWVLAGIGWGWRPMLAVAGVGTGTVGIAGGLDLTAWGTPFISYYNSILFNVAYGVSDVFGNSPLLYYFNGLAAASWSLHTLAMGYGALVWRRCWPILLMLVALLLPHSMISHKEYRFIFLAIPLLLVLSADAVAAAQIWARAHVAGWLAWPVASAAICAITVASLAGFRQQGIFKRDDRLLAALDLSRRNDVAGVLDLSGPWWISGGFYYLHHDVPYYFKEQIDALPGTEVRRLVSHVLVSAAAPDMPGFRLSARYGSVQILEQISPPPAYLALEKDGREPLQPGVDDRFTPTVRPRF
jgi:phosphatidylinositol glycan class B